MSKIENVEYGLEKIFKEAQDFLPLLGTGLCMALKVCILLRLELMASCCPSLNTSLVKGALLSF